MTALAGFLFLVLTIVFMSFVIALAVGWHFATWLVGGIARLLSWVFLNKHLR